MWHVDPTHNTFITTGNAGSESTVAQVTLFYNGGKDKYRLEKMLSPAQQLWLDVGELIRDQVLDSDGQTLPPDAMNGSYEISDLDHATVGHLYEGKLVIDRTYGHAAYGCSRCCGQSNPRLAPNPFSGPPGLNFGDVINADDSCGGYVVDVTDSGYNWASSNTAVATLPSPTLHTVAVGQASGSAWIQLESNHPEPSGNCLTITSHPQQPVTVAQAQITSADLENNQVSVSLTGPSGSSGTLEVIAIGVNNQPQITYNGGAAVGPGSYNVAFNRPYMPADTYSSVKAIWNYNAIPATATFNLTRTWLVLGTIRHSQYNTPYESACTGSLQTAWTFNSSCTFTQTSLKSDFLSQTYINGTGISQSHGILKYSTSCTNYASGANVQNSFLTVSSITGACNTAMSGGVSVATYPSPNVGNPYGCGDNALLVTSSNTNEAIKDVADYCPACSGGLNGTNGHIDDYSSSQACSGGAVGDLGNFWTADTH
jgi:hypothetical protein